MSPFVHFALALMVVAILALLVCQDRKNIHISYIIKLLIIEVLLAYFLLHSEAGLGFVKGGAVSFDKLLGFAGQGTDFVFGGMAEKTRHSSSGRYCVPSSLSLHLLVFCNTSRCCRLLSRLSVPCYKK